MFPGYKFLPVYYQCKALFNYMMYRASGEFELVKEKDMTMRGSNTQKALLDNVWIEFHEMQSLSK